MKETSREVKRLPYGAKVLAVQKALREGMLFCVETYLGIIKVEGIDSDGSWATTGHGFSQRSWAICSTDVDRWFVQTILKTAREQIKYAELKAGDEIYFEGRKGVLLSDAFYKATTSKGWFEAKVRWEDGREEKFMLNRIKLSTWQKEIKEIKETK